MLITTSFLETGDLQIDAYARRNEEFLAVEETLGSVGIDANYRPLHRDSANRDGRRYMAPAHFRPPIRSRSSRAVPAKWMVRTSACHRQSIRLSGG